ncbi:MAG: flagellar basal body L-ring protein FlgH [Opitutales bacterium]
MKTVSKSASRLLAAPFLLVLAAVPALRADSLWPATGVVERGMYADRKAARPGDILTVVVSEIVTSQNSQSTKTTRDSSITDSVTSFIFPGMAASKGVMPNLSLAGKAAYDGGGDITNTQSLTGRAAVLVTDIMPNGNLVIQGVRKVTFSGETQYIVLHGLVRQDDIGSDNTVQSSNIAEARVEFVAEGRLTTDQKRGWLANIYEKFRPF